MDGIIQLFKENPYISLALIILIAGIALSHKNNKGGGGRGGSTPNE